MGRQHFRPLPDRASKRAIRPTTGGACARWSSPCRRGHGRHDAAGKLYPQRSNGTLVNASAVAFPAIPGVQSPKTLTAAAHVERTRAGQPRPSALPFLVPQVDADGNERRGSLAGSPVPLATYTGWNFRNEKIGGTSQLVALLGSYIPLAQTKADRGASHDPRASIAERYSSKEQYLDKIGKAATALVNDGYLLAGDAEAVVKRAAEHWEYAHAARN